MDKNLFINDTDESLIPLLANGSTAAFNEIYSRYGQKIFGYFFKMLWKNNELAEDCTQDIFLKIINNAYSFNIDKSFKTWLYSIANNMCKNEYRKAESKMKNTESPIHASIASTEKNTDLKRFKIAVNDCINNLTEEKKALYILRFEEQLSVPTISQILNIPEGTIKSRIFYLLKDMKEQLIDFKTLHIYP